MKKCLIVGLITLVLFALPMTPALADGGYYIASGGESVETVAKSYALDSELVSLINDIAPDSTLAAGELLRLPQNPCFSVTVEKGDTLFSLSREYGVSVDDIQAQNTLITGNRIFPGQQLMIPLTEESSVSLFEAVEQPSHSVIYASRSGLNYLWPTIGEISSPYGERWNSFHWGLDIAADHGDAITASAAGTVLESGWKNDAYGYAVMLDHGNDRYTLYGHCSALAVEEGEYVEAGQLIAYIGSTGNSTGSHVHFEIRLDGVCVDPLLYLRQ